MSYDMKALVGLWLLVFVVALSIVFYIPYRLNKGVVEVVIETEQQRVMVEKWFD